MTETARYSFRGRDFQLVEDHATGQKASRSSDLLASILPKMKGKTVLDLGCGTGYMTIAALIDGSKKVLATDITDMHALLGKSCQLNSLDYDRVRFLRSNFYAAVPKDFKCDVIIANLPQHALPPTPEAQQLVGKYGGADGADAVVKGLTEGSYFLRKDGVYCGAVSELTNFKRTFTLAELFYKVEIKKTVTKELRIKEMVPYLTDKEVRNYLTELQTKGIIKYVEKNDAIRYKVHLCQFIKYR